MTILQVMWSCSRHRQNILGSKVINDPSLHCACKTVLRGPLHCSQCHMERHLGAKWLVSPGGWSPQISACIPHPSHYQSGERASPFIWFYSSFLGWDQSCPSKMERSPHCCKASRQGWCTRCTYHSACPSEVKVSLLSLSSELKCWSFSNSLCQ